jgi:hypothetical protein
VLPLHILLSTKKKRPFAAFAAKGLDPWAYQPAPVDRIAQVKAIVLTISPDSSGAIYSPFAFNNDKKSLPERCGGRQFTRPTNTKDEGK